MFELKNGILYKSGKAVFTLGLSYYASYHEQKVPVLAEGDRVGEMKKDIDGMLESGFNLLRMAALGDVKREKTGKVKVDFPFIDAMLAYADEAAIAAMVRLQGYSTNLSGYTDATMLNEKNEKMPFHWGWFVRGCLNHEGLLRDDEDACAASAKHFEKYSSVVSFQIYNEPAYPSKGFYDYNPHSIRAWRKWLVERGLKSAEEAEKLDAPRRRPHYDEGPSDWINWRLFHYERMNWYLNNLSDKAKQAYSKPETTTCHMPCPLRPGAAVRGEDYFRVAERMDIMGITHYAAAAGPSHYYASEILDLAESAAAVFGKHAWIVEYNAHTNMSANEWERETYSAIGSGIKGIMYYQWRADYPFADGPEPEAFGMIFNNGRKSEKFERAVSMNRLINEIGHLFVQSEKKRSGVAVLFSEYSNAVHDATDNRGVDEIPDERSAAYYLSVYRAFRKAGVSVDFARSSELIRNPLKIKLLIIPSMSSLSEIEKARIEDFTKAGGMTYSYNGFIGAFESKNFKYMADAETVLANTGITPLFDVNEKNVDVKILEGENEKGPYLVACIINIDPLEKTIPSGKTLRINGINAFGKAGFIAPGRNEKLNASLHGKTLEITLPEITTGGFILITE